MLVANIKAHKYALQMCCDIYDAYSVFVTESNRSLHILTLVMEYMLKVVYK